MTDATGTDANQDVEQLAYDDALAELQQVVARLETGGESVETTVALFARAVALQRRCDTLLGQLQLRVQQLMAGPGGEPVAAQLAREDEPE